MSKKHTLEELSNCSKVRADHTYSHDAGTIGSIK